MGLTPPTSGLRRLFLNSKSAAKVELAVAPGDVLEVSDDIAAQLAATGAGFEDFDAAGVQVFEAIAAQRTAEQSAGLAAGALDGEDDPAAVAAALVREPEPTKPASGGKAPAKRTRKPKAAE